MNFKKKLIKSLVLTVVTVIIGIVSVAEADKRPAVARQSTPQR